MNTLKEDLIESYEDKLISMAQKIEATERYWRARHDPVVDQRIVDYNAIKIQEVRGTLK